MNVRIVTSVFFVVLVHLSSGCMLGPQPEPPDVDETQAAGGDDEFDGRFYDGEGDGVYDDGAYADGDPGPCDPGLAGGEWNCDSDRDGHEPPCSEGALEIENPFRHALIPIPISDFFDDDPDPDDTTHFGELDDELQEDEDDDDDDGLLVDD